MDGIKEFDEYVNDKKLFRKKIRECKDVSELIDFLCKIAEANTTAGSRFTYKLKCKNNWGIPFEDFSINIKTGTINAYFYMGGQRCYKDIKDFSYNVYLIKYKYWGRSFGVSTH